MARLRRRMRRLTEDGQLTALQASTLVDLRKGEANTAAELAELEGVRPQSMATAVAGLEEKGLVGRRPDPADGRRQVITLTAAGEALESGSLTARREWLAHRVAAQLSADEQELLAEAAVLLNRLAQSEDEDGQE